jgi:hypothetical protein
MAKRSRGNSKRSGKPVKNEDTESSLTKEGIIRNLVNTHPVAAGRIILVMGSVLLVLATNYVTVHWQLKNLATQDDIDRICDRLNMYDQKTTELSEAVAKLEQKVDDTYPLIVSSSDVLSLEEKDNYITGTSQWEDNTLIGTTVAGEKVYAKDCIGETVAIVYKENDKSVLFLGQYNSFYHWDGFCVTNVYDIDERLLAICESDFKDGKREYYKSLVRDEENKNVIHYSDKKCTAQGNLGINIDYSCDTLPSKTFNNQSVDSKDVLYVDDVIKSSNVYMLQYYYGFSKSEKYNDSTGNAYLIKYDTDGTVLSLYKGQFLEGQPSDKTGQAFSIVYNNTADGAYYYNHGLFEAGYAKNHGTTPLSYDEIMRCIENEGIDIPLHWKF